MKRDTRRTHYPTAEQVIEEPTLCARDQGSQGVEEIYAKALDEAPKLFPPQVKERVLRGVKLKPW